MNRLRQPPPSRASLSGTSSGTIVNRKTTRTLAIGFVIGVVLGQSILNIIDGVTKNPASINSGAVIDFPTAMDAIFGSANDDDPSISEIANKTASVSDLRLEQQQHHQSLSHKVVDFERQDGVVIVTKLHGDPHVAMLEQSLCLLHYAYNHRVLYDIVVFSTLPISHASIERVKKLVAPANITFVVDNQGLQEEVNALDEVRKGRLLRRCNVTSVDEMDWYMYCMEKSKGYKKSMERIAYAWQAEFRALHIWNHPAILKYNYMLWLDTDSFCTKPWSRDPIAYMIRNRYSILFDHFPAGYSDGAEFQDRFVRAFNRTICRVSMNGDGTLKSTGGNDHPCPKTHVGQIHGFFHITDLSFYRSEAVARWTRILIGKAKFSRRFDDQIAVTAPAAILAPNKSRELEMAGLKLDVFHNYRLDGKYAVGGFVKWWGENGASNFPQAYGKCVVNHAG